MALLLFKGYLYKIKSFRGEFMSNIVYIEAQAFISICQKNGEKYLGRTATQEEIELLGNKFGELIPIWFLNLISELPLIKMEIGWQAHEPEDDYDGIESVEICTPQFMIDESFNAYPGIPILDKGYVCFGIDPRGSGDPYFINFKEDNPSVYQVYHDAGDEAETILLYGKVLVANTLSDLFKNAKLQAY